MKVDDNGTVVKPPDGGYGWVVVLSAFLVSALVLGTGYSIGVIFDLLLIEFKCSKAEVTAFASIAYALQCLLAPVASYIQHRFSARFAVISGTIFFGLALILSAFAPNIAVLYFTFGGLGGIGMALALLPTRVIVSTYFHKKRSLAVALCTMGGYVGAFLFPVLIRLLTAMYSWRGSLFIMGALQLNAVPAALLLLPVEQTVPLNHRKNENEADLQIENSKNQDPMPKMDPPDNNGLVKNGLENGSILAKWNEDSLRRKVQAGIVNQSSSMTLGPNITQMKYGRPTSDGVLAPSSSFTSSPLPFSYRSGHLSSLDNFFALYEASKFKGSSKMESSHDQHSVTENDDTPSKWSSAVHQVCWHYLKHFRNPYFTTFFIGNLFKGFILYTTSLFIVYYGTSIGLPEEQRTMLMSMIGVGHLIGRPIAAFFGDVFSGHRILVFALSHVFAGIATLLVPWITNIYFLTFFVLEFSVLTGAADVIVTPIVADIVPLHELVFGLGVIMAAEGIACFVGPLILALLPTFLLTFTIVGVTMLFNGVIVVLPHALKAISSLTTNNSASLQGELKAVT